MRNAGMALIVPKPLLIVGVREPVAQYLSLVFEHWWMYVDTPDTLTADSIRTKMVDDPWWFHCNNWFRRELGQAIGIDVFARPFPVERGWDTYENDTARVLVIRQENLDCFPQALCALRGVDYEDVIMEDRNKAESKDYASTYAKVKKTFCLDEQEIEAIYSHPQVQHFYSKDEIATFRKRWCPGTVSSASSESETLQTPPVPDPNISANQNRREAQLEPVPAKGNKRWKHPHHPQTCRPCTQCNHDLQLVPVLQQACKERLELINKLDEQLRSRTQA
jgi:hypothetical protein